MTVTLLRKMMDTSAAELEVKKSLTSEQLHDLRRSDAHSDATAARYYNNNESLHAAMKGLDVFKQVAPQIFNPPVAEKNALEPAQKKRRTSDRIMCSNDPSSTPEYIKKYMKK